MKTNKISDISTKEMDEQTDLFDRVTAIRKKIKKLEEDLGRIPLIKLNPSEDPNDFARDLDKLEEWKEKTIKIRELYEKLNNALVDTSKIIHKKYKKVSKKENKDITKIRSVVAKVKQKIAEKNIDKLISVLKKIESDKSIPKKEYLDENNALVKEAGDLANDLLIINGKPNFKNMDTLKSKGFITEPGETDSFGWVTGIIHTKKGELMFG